MAERIIIGTCPRCKKVKTNPADIELIDAGSVCTDCDNRKETQVNYSRLWEMLKGTEEGKKVCAEAKVTFEAIEEENAKDPEQCWKMLFKALWDMVPGIWRLRTDKHKSKTFVYISEKRDIVASKCIENVSCPDEIVDTASSMIEHLIADRGIPKKIYIYDKKLCEALAERGFPVEWKPEVNK